MIVQNFITLVRPHAIEINRLYNIPIPISIAQSALETGWGRSRLAVYASNYFGIKAGRRWRGRVFETITWEVINGQRKDVIARFRQYPNVRESFLDYGRFLQQPRYRNVTRNARTSEEFIRAIHRAGYATDPEYPEKIMNIIRRNNLENIVTGGSLNIMITE